MQTQSPIPETAPFAPLEGVVLEDRRPESRRIGRPEGRNALFGEVADLPGYDTPICRWFVFDADGSHSHGYGPYSREEGRMTAAWQAPPPCPVQRFQIVMKEHVRGLTGLDTPAEKALAKFQADYPGVLDLLKIKLPKREDGESLFKLGDVFGGSTVGGNNVVLDWRHYLAQHASGKFGFHGEYDPAELDAARAWAIGLQPRNIINSHAIRARSGVVVSQWDLPPDLTELARTEDQKRAWAPPKFVISIATHLAAPFNRTIVMVHDRNVTLFS